MPNLLKIFRPAVGRAVSALMPESCAFCATRAGEECICTQCAKLLPWNDVFCEWCGQPLPAQLAAGVACAHCQLQPPPFNKARAPLVYGFPVDNAIKALKFRHQLHYIPAFASLLLPVLQKEFSHCDALVPVPLYRWRQARRGFNQAIEICRPLRKVSGLRIVTDIERAKATLSQTGLSAKQRRQNLRDAFALPELLTCRYPLVVDDVITTGATATQLARILLKAGAMNVSVLAVARARQS